MNKFIFLLWMAIATTASAGNWLPVKDISLMIEPNSILDFSGLVPQRKMDEKCFAGHLLGGGLAVPLCWIAAGFDEKADMPIGANRKQRVELATACDIEDSET